LNFVFSGLSEFTVSKMKQGEVLINLHSGELVFVRKILTVSVIFLFLRFISPSFAIAATLGFSLDEIEIPEDVEVRVLLLPFSEESRPRLILIESDEDELRSLSSYSFGRGLNVPPNNDPWDTWIQDYQMQLAPEIQFFDIARLGSRHYLVGYRNPELLFLDPESNRFEPLLSVGSLFHGKLNAEINYAEFVRDLNDDERDDVMVPDFDGWQISLQKRDGSFTPPRTIGPPARMNIGSERFAYYRAREPFFMDYNNDGYKDLAFWVEGEFLVYHQQADGQYDDEPVIFNPGIGGIIEEDDLSFGGEDSDDDTENENRILSAIEDLNGDGVTDLLIQAFEVDGLFGTKTRIEVHLGGIGSSGRLEFSPTPDSVVLSKGIQFGSERMDINDDGAAEMMVISVKVSIATMIRALIARTVVLDIGIYQMSNGKYPTNPNINRKVTVTLDFSNGDVSIPAIALADITGDGLKDLLVQEGPNKLDVFPGNGTQELFANKPIKLKFNLPDMQPELGQTLQVEDLDGDGRDELVMLFDPAEGPGRVVIARFHN
jgi:hypothetical protein